MKKVYVTITGMKYYYGFNPFSIGKKLKCKKDTTTRMTARQLRSR